MKKVTFNTENNKTYFMVTWNFAYQSSRKRYWEFLSIDRMRFNRRVEKISNIISPILENNHRCNIFNDRFK